MVNNSTIHSILITGGTGFIGSNLLYDLVTNNPDIDISLILRKKSRNWRLSWLQKKKKVNCYYSNLIEYNKIESIVSRIKPDVLIHLAAYGVVNPRDQNIRKSIKINVDSTLHLYDVFNKYCGQKFVFFGSCFEYGRKQKKPISESDMPDPLNIYALTKIMAVKALEMNQGNNSNIIILRPFGIYGEYEDYSRLFPYVILNLLKNKKIYLTPGNQIRDYIYVTDLIKAIKISMEIRPPNRFEIFNIGSGIEHSIKQIVLKIASHLKIKEKDQLINLGKIPYRKNEMMYLVAQNKKARQILKWRPTTDIDTGIKKMIEWYRTNSYYYKSQTK
jgi:nucleoside-diphosphate-sugar epimerase